VNFTSIRNKIVSLTAEDWHRRLQEIVDAQGYLLLTYREGGSVSQLLEALDQVLERARANFRDQEACMNDFSNDRDAAHLAAHHGILRQMGNVRIHIQNNSRDLLSHLLFLDRWLMTHIIDELLAPIYGRPIPVSGASCLHDGYSEKPSVAERAMLPEHMMGAIVAA